MKAMSLADTISELLWNRQQNEQGKALQAQSDIQQRAFDMQTRRDALARYSDSIGLSSLLATTARFPDTALDLGYAPEAPPAGPSDEYRAKLKAIGATALLREVDADVECARFIDEVKSRGLRFYNRVNVEAYLLSEAQKALPAAMRESSLMGAVLSGMRVEWTPVATYTQAIPAPVIDTMVWVKQDFPAAEFFISEVKRYPDPFLMVRLHGRVFIIEKWDEPGYREE